MTPEIEALVAELDSVIHHCQCLGTGTFASRPCPYCRLYREVASALVALSEELTARNDARDRAFAAFGHKAQRGANGECQCPYCMHDADALGEMTAEYELRAYCAEQKLKELGAQVVTLSEERDKLKDELTDEEAWSEELRVDIQKWAEEADRLRDKLAALSEERDRKCVHCGGPNPIVCNRCHCMVAYAPIPALSEGRAHDLHQRIMNIPCEPAAHVCDQSPIGAYTLGHRDARHDAAELVSAQEAAEGRAHGWQPIIERELEKATAKFPSWPIRGTDAAAIVAEECGELQQAVLQAMYEGGTVEAVRKEAIQTAAMAIQFLLNLPETSFAQGPQPQTLKRRQLAAPPEVRVREEEK